MALDQGNASAETGGPRRGHQAGGASADDHEIVAAGGARIFPAGRMNRSHERLIVLIVRLDSRLNLHHPPFCAMYVEAMALIKTTRPDSPPPGDAVTYKRISATPGPLAAILQIQGLTPDTQDAHYHFYRTLMFGKSALSRAQRELIAVAVSQTNECHY
jgi:hypothetical protein